MRYYTKMKLKVTPLEIETLINRDDFDSVDIGVKKGLSFEEAVQRTGGLGITRIIILFRLISYLCSHFLCFRNGNKWLPLLFPALPNSIPLIHLPR